MKSVGEEKEADPPLLSGNRLSDENLQIILEIRKNKEGQLHSQRNLEHIMDILFDALGMLLCGIDAQHVAKSSSSPTTSIISRAHPKIISSIFSIFFLLSSQARWSWRPVSDHFVHTIFFMW
jgi:hypothetical protein